MLVRSAGRRQRQRNARIIAANFAQLQLPWLAPAQVRWAASHAPATKRRGTATSLPPHSQTRRLATATESTSSSVGNPLLSLGYGQSGDRFDDKSGLRWPPTTSTPESYDSHGRSRGTAFATLAQDHVAETSLFSIQSGINGTFEELLQHLHISIRIGRTARAESIVRRLIEQTSPSAPEVSYAHSTYLNNMRTKIENYERGSPQALAAFQEMERWMTSVILGQNCPLSEQILVTMLKAAIRALPDDHRNQTLRNYTERAHSVSESFFDDVVSSEDLDDAEYLLVSRAISSATEPLLDSPAALDASQSESEFQVANEEVAQQSTTMADTSRVAIDSTNQHTPSFPEARPANQYSQSLMGIKGVLGAYSKFPSLPADATEQEKEARAYARQKVLEEAAVSSAIERWRKASEDLRKIGINTVMQSKPLAALLWQWHEALMALLKRELVEVKKTLDQPHSAGNVDQRTYGPYLEVLPLDKLSAVAILHMVTMFTSRSMTEEFNTSKKVSSLALSIGEAVRQEALLEAAKKGLGKKKMSPAASKRFGKAILRRLRSSSSRLGEQESFAARPPASWEVALRTEWPKEVVVKLGALLVSKLIEAAQLPVTRKHPRTGQMITQLQPALLYRVKWSLGKRLGVVVPNPALLEKLQTERVGEWVAKKMPMVVKPKPWTGWDEGGYLFYSSPVARTANDDGTCRNYILAAMDHGDLKPVFSGLDALGKVAWKVDEDVLRVQLEAWNSGQAIGNFAPQVPEFDIPPEPAASEDVNVRRHWLRAMAEIENKRNGFHSQRCFQNFQLEVARGMVGERLYFPHNIDFRGRAYPMSPYLNHMGADNARALLTFADGKPLGESGLRWLKIHLATVAGFDKASLDERVEFTMKHLDDIYDSVRRPLEGNKWWLQAEDAWQTLAACFELTRALDSPEPSKYVSHLPIHQDGTCNGLQHYAALGGDEVGARQVNLEPGDRPSDVYTAVADAVREEIRLEAERGDPVAQKLDGHITRKCVKQPVMTNVYGVTLFGAKGQVMKQIQSIFPDAKKDDAVTPKMMATLIATKIYKCLGDMFSGAQSIQDWLGECALRITTSVTPQQIATLARAKKAQASEKDKANDEDAATRVAKRPIRHNKEAKMSIFAALQNGLLFKSTVVWTTPLGLPVAQPYRTVKGKSVQTNLQAITLQQPQMWHPVSKRKQMQGFAPNFIHSLDASHMLLSANKSTELGIHFASIHDSFWTHACDVDTLSTVLRDAFVSIHSDDVIGRLRQEFQARYKGSMYLKSVMTSPEVAEEVYRARRALTKGGRNVELLGEVERIRLLNSEDPAERETGMAMVTPGSVIAAAEKESAASQAPEDTGINRLGRLPKHNNPLDELATESVSDTSDAHHTLEAATTDVEDLDAEAELHVDATPASPSPDGDLKSARVKIQVWSPVEFPEVPAKGRFDVARLRNSKYFFH